jgi:arsenite-transporting ATPase
VHYRFFGGKGGNGKTTCAAATAMALAERGHHVLLVSTDPAHALGDILDKKLTTQPLPLRVRRGVLRACELDPDRALARWMTRRRPQLSAIFERGTILERADIERFLELSLPGVDELFGLVEVERLASQHTYDDVVIDTAPTGHTLRLLATPALLTSIARVLDALQEKHRVLSETFRRGARSTRDASDALIQELQADGQRLRDLLRDRSQTRLCWVLLPEEMSVRESIRALAALEFEGIRAGEIIANRVTPPPPSWCALCNGRRRYEAEWLTAISREWSKQKVRLSMLPAYERPPRGLSALRSVIASVAPLKPRRAPRARRNPPRHEHGSEQKLPRVLQPSRLTRLVMMGGKGGVGKSTCAAALALAIARADPDRRVLLLSTDPAHSLGDVLGEEIGDAEQSIPAGNNATLIVREIDAAAGWQRWRARYLESIDAVFAKLAGPDADLSVDRTIVEELFDLAPPGMDEVVGMLAIVEALTRKASPVDLVVVDTAPTGHTLRLLELPEQAHAWVRQIMRVMLKYRLAARADRLSAEVVWLSKGLTALEKLLTNERGAGFVVVTRPEQLPAIQTRRLVKWLRRRRIAIRALIVNGVTPPGCARCRRVAARERRLISGFGEEAVLADAVAPPPRGPAAIEHWGATWREKS